MAQPNYGPPQAVTTYVGDAGVQVNLPAMQPQINVPVPEVTVNVPEQHAVFNVPTPTVTVRVPPFEKPIFNINVPPVAPAPIQYIPPPVNIPAMDIPQPSVHVQAPVLQVYVLGNGPLPLPDKDCFVVLNGIKDSVYTGASSPFTILPIKAHTKLTTTSAKTNPSQYDNEEFMTKAAIQRLITTENGKLRREIALAQDEPAASRAHVDTSGLRDELIQLIDYRLKRHEGEMQTNNKDHLGRVNQSIKQKTDMLKTELTQYIETRFTSALQHYNSFFVSRTEVQALVSKHVKELQKQ